jgi:7,8-dihydro-6-hydroxymethylpterin-pyrophosphokinase
VLEPLNQIAPKLILPNQTEPVHALLARLPKDPQMRLV